MIATEDTIKERQPSPKLSYKGSGVDIETGNQLIELIKPITRSTARPGADGKIGGFGGIFDLKAAHYRDPILVAANDGVGTKLKLAIETNNHKQVGIDLVAMCVNDLVVQGAEPLFFLDYYATGKLSLGSAKEVINGIAEGCLTAGCALIGGETAEMPGLVGDDMIELSGFGIGAVEKSNVVDPTSIAEGDVFIGYPSDGIHANGWSLVRKILSQYPDEFNDEDVVSMLAPTRLYYDVLSGYRDMGIKPKAMAHITGGGLPENLERILGDLGGELKVPEWSLGSVQKILSHVEINEAFSTFNMGIGWVSVLDPNDVDSSLKSYNGAVKLGEVSNDNLTVRLG